MKLLLLHCPSCQAPLTPQNDDFIVSCGQCLAAALLGNQGVKPVDVRYAQPQPNVKISEWLPFWILTGKINLIERKTQGGNNNREAEQLWGQSRQLYVPAWEQPLKQAQQIGGQLIQRQPKYHLFTGSRQTPMRSVTFMQEDTVKLLEFIVLAIEARRKDWLKSLRFTLDLQKPTLWALPADGQRIVAVEA